MADTNRLISLAEQAAAQDWDADASLAALGRLRETAAISGQDMQQLTELAPGLPLAVILHLVRYVVTLCEDSGDEDLYLFGTQVCLECANHSRSQIPTPPARAWIQGAQHLISLAASGARPARVSVVERLRHWLRQRAPRDTRLPQAHVRMISGDLDVREDQLDAARKNYADALKGYRAIQKRLGEANTLQSLGDLDAREDQLEAARKNYDAALTGYRKIQDRLGAANTLQSLGDLDVRESNLDAARKNYADALPIFRAIQNRRGEANTLMMMGVLDAFEGRLDAAGKNYDAALPIFHAIQDRLGEANTLMGMGHLDHREAKLDAARKNYDAALTIYIEIQDRLGEANTLMGMGHLDRHEAKLDAAHKNYADALRLYREIRNRRGEANTLQNLGDFDARESKLVQARARYDSALRRFRKIQERKGEANTLRALGDLDRREAKLDAAHKNYADALRLYRAIQDRRGEANTLMSLGDLDVREDKLDAARKNYDAALPIYVEIQERLGEAITLQSLGRLLLATRPQDALDLLRDGLARLESARGALTSEHDRQRFSQTLVGSYRVAVEACLALGLADEGWHWVARAKGALLRDQFGSTLFPALGDNPDDPRSKAYAAWVALERRLANISKPPADDAEKRDRAADGEPATLRAQAEGAWQAFLDSLSQEDRRLATVMVQPVAQLLAEARELAAGDRALWVEFFGLENGVAVFAIPLWQAAPAIHARRMDVDPAFFAPLAGQLAQPYQHTRSRGDAHAPASDDIKAAIARNMAALGKDFVQPLMAWLRAELPDLGDATLLLAPHGLLHRLPLHAAPLADGAPLIAAYPVVYIPNAALPAQLLARRTQAAGAGRLAAGPADPKLTFASDEVAQLSRGWGIDPALTLARMTLATVLGLLGDLRVLHLATHSWTAADIANAAIQFWDEHLTVRRILSDRARVRLAGLRLLYLSSCESGVSALDRTDDVQGLMIACMWAGARSVLGSLWAVNDGAARDMALELHTAWDSGASLARAFQTAQLTVRALDREDYLRWAPFALFGDPG